MDIIWSRNFALVGQIIFLWVPGSLGRDCFIFDYVLYFFQRNIRTELNRSLARKMINNCITITIVIFSRSPLIPLAYNLSWKTNLLNLLLLHNQHFFPDYVCALGGLNPRRIEFKESWRYWVARLAKDCGVIAQYWI